MESFIVRIYRMEDNNRDSIVGVVECVGAEERKAFKNLEEHWSILNLKNLKEGGEIRSNFSLVKEYKLGITGDFLKTISNKKEEGDV